MVVIISFHIKFGNNFYTTLFIIYHSLICITSIISFYVTYIATAALHTICTVVCNNDQVISRIEQCCNICKQLLDDNKHGITDESIIKLQTIKLI